MTLKKMAVLGIAAIALAISVSRAVLAGPFLVANGSFETTTNGAGQLGYNTAATGWSVPGGSYTFLFTPGSADTTGAIGQYGALVLWGPGNGSANGLPATSPDGGNFIGQDPVFQTGALSQTIKGLTPGTTYALSFYYAGAQQYGYTGDTTEGWQVSLGSETQQTPILNNANHGFTGWQSVTFYYTATSSTELLSFLALGTPDGVPPFALLDGVSLNPTPEPSSMTLMFVGMVGVGAYSRLRRRAKVATA